MILDYYFYHSLNNVEKLFYKDLLEAIKNRKNVVMLPDATDENISVEKVFAAVGNDNPHLFYFNCNQLMKGSGIIGSGIMLDYYYDENETQKLNSELQNKVNWIISDVQGATEIDKAIRLYEKLVQNTEYDHADSNDESVMARNHTVIGPLLEGKGVCEGIAKAYKLLLNAVGIRCLVASGEASELIGGAQSNHAWNIVKVGDDSFHVDATWAVGADNKESINYDYFGLSDERISVDHRLDAGLPECETDKYDYFIMHQKSVANKNDLISVLENQINIPGRLYIRLDYDCNYEVESKKIIEIVKDKVTNSDSQILVKSHGRPSQKILIISLSIPD